MSEEKPEKAYQESKAVRVREICGKLEMPGRAHQGGCEQ